MSVCLRVCVCVCVRVRERETHRESLCGACASRDGPSFSPWNLEYQLLYSRSAPTHTPTTTSLANHSPISDQMSPLLVKRPVSLGLGRKAPWAAPKMLSRQRGQ